MGCSNQGYEVTDMVGFQKTRSQVNNNIKGAQNNGYYILSRSSFSCTGYEWWSKHDEVLFSLPT